MNFAKSLFLLSTFLLIALSRSDDETKQVSNSNYGSGEVEEKMVKETVIPDGHEGTEEHLEPDDKEEEHEEDDEHHEHDDEHKEHDHKEHGEKHEEAERKEEEKDDDDHEDKDDDKDEVTTASIERIHTRPRKDGVRENLTNYDNGSCQLTWSITNILLLLIISIFGH